MKLGNFLLDLLIFWVALTLAGALLGCVHVFMPHDSARAAPAAAPSESSSALSAPSAPLATDLPSRADIVGVSPSHLYVCVKPDAEEKLQCGTYEQFQKTTGWGCQCAPQAAPQPTPESLPAEPSPQVHGL